MSELPEGWVETSLGNSINLVGGGTPKTSITEYWNGEIPWLSVVDFNNGSRWVSKTEKTITDKGLNSSSTKLLNGGDLIISARGTVGALAQLKVQMAFNQSCYGIKKKKKISDINFLYYLIRFSLLKIGKHVHGAVFDTITRQTFDNISINLPPLPEQKTIAKLLSSFDEKIELLQSQNEILEILAQTIFKEWFCVFNYPSATGKMVDSELGDIPKGWRIDSIDKLVELIIDYRGKTPKKLGMDWSEKGIQALSAKTIKNGKIVRQDAMNLGSRELYDLWMKDELQKNDILLTSEAPLGEMYYLVEDTKYILSQRLFALRVNKEVTSEYLYHYLFSPLGQSLLNARASGSTVQGIRQSELRKIDVIVPEKEVLQKASEIFASIFNKTFVNNKQIQTLTTSRNTLLPKLMIGEIRIKGFE